MTIKYEKFLIVPENIQDQVRSMMYEKSYEKRDNYRVRLQSIIEFCTQALELEIKDRQNKSAEARKRREEEKKDREYGLADRVSKV